ncbi:MAG TPA: hypothetical protein DCK95_09290, partial [Anaerolineaceae bacterium]|nr:hypothetical protein [Anaerolineaceae bacterium]
MELFYPIELAFTHFLQNLGSWLLPIMRIFTFFGNEEFYLLVMPILYWCVDAALGLRIGIMLVLSGTLNGIMKLIFKRPRPYWIDKTVTAHISESSFGMPSGHAMNAMSVWGLFAASVPKKAIKTVSIVLIVMVGISRIYLGVHFSSDVFVGWLLGGLLLILYLRNEKRISMWVKELPLGRLVFILFFISLVLIGLGALSLATPGNWEIPPSWLETAAMTDPSGEINPLSLEGTISNAAIFFGLTSGAACIHFLGGFNNQGTWQQHILKFLIGLCGIVIL